MENCLVLTLHGLFVSVPISPIKELIEKSEQKFACNNFEVPYLLIKGDGFGKNLVVIFSAFNDERVENGHSYNFVRTLYEFQGNKLFILDCVGPRGSYYLGAAPEFAFADTVYTLIERVRSDLDIPKKNVLCIGSSKGGTSALIHGIRGGYGGVIAGTPQTKIATYVEKCSPSTYEFMFSGIPEWIAKGDRLLLDLCNRSVNTRIWLITNPYDWQYSDHIEPFIKAVGANLSNLRVFIVNDIRNHQDIASYFVNSLSHLVTNFLLESSIRSYEIDYGNQFRPYAPSDINLYECSTKTLIVPSDRVVYLQSFDGSFDSPPKEEAGRRLGRIPAHCSSIIIKMSISVTGPLNLVLFVMQYREGENVCSKVNKVVNCSEGQIAIDFPTKVAPSADYLKVALRFKSTTECRVILNRVQITYVEW